MKLVYYKAAVSLLVTFSIANLFPMSVHAQTASKTAADSSSSTRAKVEDHQSSFLEDPFITEYRRKFFSVFQGKTAEFEGGMSELDMMLQKNPDDARALVWRGNGLMVRAGLLKLRGKGEEGKRLLQESRKEMDRAVSISPDDVNIIAMRAVTVHMMGMYWKNEDIPAGSWEALIADLEKTRKLIGGERFKQISVHARGEILTELANGYKRVGKMKQANTLWRETLLLAPDSRYSRMAEKALAEPDKSKKKARQ